MGKLDVIFSQPVTTKLEDAMPEKNPNLEGLISFPDIQTLKCYTQCCCQAYACGDFFFGSSSECQCLYCMKQRGANLCCEWNFKQGFCGSTSACFCLKCCMVNNAQQNCPCVCTGYTQQAIFTAMETNCAGADQRSDCCSQSYSECMLLEKQEACLFNMGKCLCCVNMCALFHPKLPCGLALFGIRCCGGPQ